MRNQVFTLLIHSAVLFPSITRTLAQSPTIPANDAQSTCYVGPIDISVVNPDGSPVADIPIGVFGTSWTRTKADPSVKWIGRTRSDASGRHHRDSERECAFPTFHYAFDESHGWAGITLIPSHAALAGTQTIRLQSARWVRGKITSLALEANGQPPAYVCAWLSPILDPKVRMRYLRYYSEMDGEFAFLVPPGEYRLDFQADRCAKSSNVALVVPPGAGDILLPQINLELSPLARRTGQPPPALAVSVWSDGREHRLDDHGGEPMMVCFWDARSLDARLLREMFEIATSCAQANIPFQAIHTPVAGGFAEVEHYLCRSLADEEQATDLDTRSWPFPVGIDRMLAPAELPGYFSGESLAALGTEFAFPLFVLIDEAGRVVANSHDQVPDFDHEFKGAMESMRR